MTTPTARTLALLRKLGWTACVVEKWLPIPDRTKPPCPACGRYPNIPVRKDVAGCIDVLAWGRPGITGVLAVQVTTADNMAARYVKSIASIELHAWLRSFESFEIHGWHQVAGKWQVKIRPVTLADVEGVVIGPRAKLPRRKKSQQAELFSN